MVRPRSTKDSWAAIAAIDDTKPRPDGSENSQAVGAFDPGDFSAWLRDRAGASQGWRAATEALSSRKGISRRAQDRQQGPNRQVLIGLVIWRRVLDEAGRAEMWSRRDPRSLPRSSRFSRERVAILDCAEWSVPPAT